MAEANRRRRAIASLSVRFDRAGWCHLARLLRLPSARPGAIGWRGPLAVLLGLLLGAGGLTARALARPVATVKPVVAVPQGFVGVDADGPLFDPTAQLNLGRQLTEMVAHGVQSVRVAFDWAAAQPFASFNDPAYVALSPVQKSDYTNVGGVPTDFAPIDQFVGLAAQRGLTVLPTVLYSPGWDSLANHSGGLAIPADPAPYGRFLAGLIYRYGPHGSFWSANPQIKRLPIRRWQIWNEPNLAYYWPQPFAPSYVRVLRAAHAAIKQADPGAQVVLGALTNFAWKSIGQILRVSGARSLFDIATVNAFTKTPANVILYLRLMRNALARLGEAKLPLIDSEMSWPSALGKTPQRWDFDTSESGQARNIAALLPMLAAQRVSLGLLSFYYYTWVGNEAPRSPAFNYAGLLALRHGSVVAKPALSVFTKGVLSLERCQRVSNLATRCARPINPAR